MHAGNGINIPSIHLVGNEDTADVQHMVGRIAGLCGSDSGICVF